MTNIYEQTMNNYNNDKKSVVILDIIETEEQIINKQHYRFIDLIKKYSHIIHVKINDYYTLNAELPYDIKIMIESNEFNNYINYDDTIKRWFYINILKKQLYYSSKFIFIKMINEIHKMNAHIHDYNSEFDGKTVHLIRKFI